MSKLQEIKDFIIFSSNPTVYNTYQLHGKKLYIHDENGNWKQDFTDEKIIAMLFDMVKNLDEVNK
jgi:hypothetical protein